MNKITIKISRAYFDAKENSLPKGCEERHKKLIAAAGYERCMTFIMEAV